MRELLGLPKDMVATTGSEMMNVIRLKTSYMNCNLISFVLKSSLIANDKGATKWKISSRVYSRAKKLVTNAKKQNTSLLLDLQKCGVKQSDLQYVWCAKQHGIKSIIKNILNSIWKLIGNGQGTTVLTSQKEQKEQVANTAIENSEKIEKQYTKHTVESACVAGKTIFSFLLLIMSIVMVTLKENLANIQVVRNFTISLFNKVSQTLISCFVIIATWVGPETTGFALIGKVQRLSLRRVRSSDRMYALPYWGKDIVPSA